MERWCGVDGTDDMRGERSGLCEGPEGLKSRNP